MNEYIYVINTSDKPLSFQLSDTIPIIKANNGFHTPFKIMTMFSFIIF